MAKLDQQEKLKIENVIISFVYVAKPKQSNNGTATKYNVTMRIPKLNTVLVDTVKKAIAPLSDECEANTETAVDFEVRKEQEEEVE